MCCRAMQAYCASCMPVVQSFMRLVLPSFFPPCYFHRTNGWAKHVVAIHLRSVGVGTTDFTTHTRQPDSIGCYRRPWVDGTSRRGRVWVTGIHRAEIRALERVRTGVSKAARSAFWTGCRGFGNRSSTVDLDPINFRLFYFRVTRHSMSYDCLPHHDPSTNFDHEPSCIHPPRAEGPLVHQPVAPRCEHAPSPGRRHCRP